MDTTFQYVRRGDYILPPNVNPFSAKWIIVDGVYRPDSWIFTCASVEWLRRFHPEDVKEYLEEVFKQWDARHTDIYRNNSVAAQITNFLYWDETADPDKWRDYYNEACKHMREGIIRP